MTKKNKKHKKLTVLDLFSGSGGLSYGFQEAGYEIVMGTDNDGASLETFKKNHPGSKVFIGDITKSLPALIKEISGIKIDAVIGGPPCQGFSLAGPRKLNDPRNRLFKSFVDVVGRIRPPAFVLENVPGLLGLYKGEVRENLIKEFSRMGYAVEYKLLNAADYGVPQTRKRVFFVGLKKGSGIFKFPRPTHTGKGRLPRSWKKYVTCEDALSDLPPLINDTGEEVQKYASPQKNSYQKLMRRKSELVYNHIAAVHSKKVTEIISLVPEGKNYKSLPEHLKNSRNFHVAWTRYHGKKPAPTIDTGHRHHFHYKYNRVPTVRECARLQSFPDDFIFIGNKTEQFRQVGNAVPPLLARAVAEQLKKFI